MAVKLVTTIQRWIGVSTDAKPVSAPVGSTFYEPDTGRSWIWDGQSWKEDIASRKADDDITRRLLELLLVEAMEINNRMLTLIETVKKTAE